MLPLVSHLDDPILLGKVIHLLSGFMCVLMHAAIVKVRA